MLSRAEQTELGQSYFHNHDDFMESDRRTMLRMYQSCVLAIFLYYSESWRMAEQDTFRLSQFPQNKSLENLEYILASSNRQ